MKWEVKIAKRVLKQIKRIPKEDAKRLLIVLDALGNNLCSEFIYLTAGISSLIIN